MAKKKKNIKSSTKKKTTKKAVSKKKSAKKTSKKKAMGFASSGSYNRVRKILWANFKDDFTSYRDFISNEKDNDGNKIKGTSLVSRVYSQCKSIECTDQDIIEIYRNLKDPKGEGIPLIPGNYYDAHPYYELLTEDWWDGLDQRVWVYSPMLIPQPSDFLGILGESKCVNKDNQIKPTKECDPEKGDKFIEGKKELFHPYVTYCNAFQTQGFLTDSDEVPHFRFMGENEDDEEPYWNEELNRWEIQIVPCDPSGDINSYGFDPIDEDKLPDEGDIPESAFPVHPDAKDDEKPDKDKKESDIEKETKSKIELEKEKRKTLEQEEKTATAKAKAEEKKAIADIISMWKSGDLTKKEMMEMIKMIKE